MVKILFFKGVFYLCTATLTSSSGDKENVVLNERLANKGMFYCGTKIPLTTTPPLVNDGILQIQNGDQISVYYQDIDFPDDFCRDNAVIKSGSDISKVTDHVPPDNFKLYQNFPNPFNASTAISFQLSVVNNVKFSIFNAIGQKICTLINESKELPADLIVSR